MWFLYNLRKHQTKKFTAKLNIYLSSALKNLNNITFEE
jgi:hypothetical protein